MKKIQIGDILCSTFGYDACIASFWKVLKRTEKSVTIAEILDHVHTGTWFDGTAAPILTNTKIGLPKRKKVKTWYDNSNEFAESEYGAASLWDGSSVKTYNHH